MPGMRADVNVLAIDKFPRMLDYVVPSGVRIGDGDRVRLGAYLSEGTTVMHAGPAAAFSLSNTSILVPAVT
mgnify:CR=1 FL=1